ncbi:MAG: hypothetical protein B7733_20975 [Myxococcales bacterium FL481]|nr:MAG: hypothetical protein B7733_20975 [Myxococcales bacterium FL481]
MAPPSGPAEPRGGGRPVGRQPVAESPPLPAVDPANYRLSLTGNILSGLGVVSFLGSVASLVVRRDADAKLDYPQIDEDPADIAQRRRDLDQRKQAATISMWTTAAMAVGLVSAGATMITVARRREAKRRERLGLSAFVPVLAPRSAGVVWLLRW